MVQMDAHSRASGAVQDEMTGHSPTFVVGDVPVYGELVLAPLAGYSDQPYRCICRRMGSAMSYTEFVSAHGVLRDNARTMELLQFGPQERPVVFQVFGHDPSLLAQACLRLQDLGADIIDINMGCPVSRVSGKGGGAGLLKDPDKIAQIFATLTQTLSVPITGKIRLGWDQATRNYLQVARILEDNGAALIAVHGRTREDTYKVPADWDAIAEIKRIVHIPVLGNGDVRCVADIARIKQHTDCDGIMIGRGAIGNPWIFEQRDQHDVPAEERIKTIQEHLDRAVAFYGEKRGVLTFRKHAVQYIRGLPGAGKLRAKLVKCVTADQVTEQLLHFLHPSQNVL
jgi:nifR3 family TIM-barrel protein